MIVPYPRANSWDGNSEEEKESHCSWLCTLPSPHDWPGLYSLHLAILRLFIWMDNRPRSEYKHFINQTNSIVKKSKLRLQPRFRTLGGTGVERQISILWVAYNSANTNRGIPFLRQTISLGRHLFFVLRSEFFVVLTNVNGLLFHWTILLPTQQTF